MNRTLVVIINIFDCFSIDFLRIKSVCVSQKIARFSFQENAPASNGKSPAAASPGVVDRYAELEKKKSACK